MDRLALRNSKLRSFSRLRTPEYLVTKMDKFRSNYKLVGFCDGFFVEFTLLG